MANTNFLTPSGKKAIYYYTQWSTYGRNFQVADIPEDVIDIAYAFWNINSDGTIISADSYADTGKVFPDGGNGNFGEFQKILATGRKLNVKLCIGGWTFSTYFSNAVSTATTRTTFVNSIISTFQNPQSNFFNGIIIDWEYLSNDGINYGSLGTNSVPANIATVNDCSNFILFLKELRIAFTTNKMTTYTIGMCCTAAPEKAKFDINLFPPLVDELHIMTYDFHDGNFGETETAHHTNPRKSSYGIYSADEAAQFYINAGFPSKKVFIGGAFYTRGFANTTGLGQSANGGTGDCAIFDPGEPWPYPSNCPTYVAPTGPRPNVNNTPPDPCNPNCQQVGILPYNEVITLGTIQQDPESKGAYIYNNDTNKVYTFDSEASLLEKIKIIAELDLGGIIIWENSGDVTNYEESLTKVLTDNLTSSFTPYITTAAPTSKPSSSSSSSKPSSSSSSPSSSSSSSSKPSSSSPSSSSKPSSSSSSSKPVYSSTTSSQIITSYNVYKWLLISFIILVIIIIIVYYYMKKKHIKFFGHFL